MVLNLDHLPAMTVEPAGEDGNEAPGAVTEQEEPRGAVSAPGTVRDVIKGKGRLKGGALAGISGRHEGSGTRWQLPANSKRDWDLDLDGALGSAVFLA